MTETLTRKEQIDRAHRMVVALCSRRREWRMSIPARPDYDPDLVIGDGLRAGLSALAEVEQLTRERDEAREHIATLERALREMCELAEAAPATAFDDASETKLRERIAAARALLEREGTDGGAP